MSAQNNPGVLGAVRKARGVWLLHVAGNALLFAALFGWLSIPDARTWQLGLSALLGLGIVAGALWLHGGTLAYFEGAHRGAEKPWPACGGICRKLPALAAWVLLLLVVCWGVDWIQAQVPGWATWWASWLTLKLQKPVLLADVENFFRWIVFALRWFLVPLALLPVAAQVVRRGFPGFADVGRAWRIARRPKWWLGYSLAYVVGAYVPDKLVSWLPELQGLTVESLSMLARIVPAYLLLTGAWLFVLSLLARLDADAGGDVHD